jgi:hypothetical protein
MTMMTFLSHAVALLIGVGGGWYAKGKFGTKVQAVEDAVKKT